MLLSFDVLINNWDRFPFIWQHEGNAGNFLFLANDLSRPVVGIDQCVTSIEPMGDSLTSNKQYINKVKSLLQELELFAPSISTSSVNDTNEKNCQILCSRILPFINANTTLNLKSIHLSFIVFGMIKGILSIVENVTASKMESIYKGLYDAVCDYTSTLPNKGDTVTVYGIAFVSIPFLESILKLFSSSKPALENRLLIWASEVSH